MIKIFTYFDVNFSMILPNNLIFFRLIVWPHNFKESTPKVDQLLSQNMFSLVSSFDVDFVTSIYYFQYAFNQYLVKFPFAFLTQDLHTHNMFVFEKRLPLINIWNCSNLYLKKCLNLPCISHNNKAGPCLSHLIWN